MPRTNFEQNNGQSSHNMQALEINVPEVLHNTIKTKTVEVKQKDLALWKQQSVYIEVRNEGQHTGSKCWVVLPKVIN